MRTSVYVIVLCGCMAAQHSSWAASLDGKSRTTSGSTNQIIKVRTTPLASQPRVMTPAMQTTTTPVRAFTSGPRQTTTRAGNTTGGSQSPSLGGSTIGRTPSTSLVDRAKKDKKDIKQNIQDDFKQQMTEGAQKGADGHNPFFGLQGDGKGGGQTPGGVWVGGGSNPTKEGGKGDVFRGLRSDVPAIPGGSKYNDTFGGERLNNRRGYGGNDPGNFTGGGRGRSSEDDGMGGQSGHTGPMDGGDDGMSGQSGADAETVGAMLRDEGGTPTGDLNKDRAELGYAQHVGTDGYAATKNMNAKQREDYWAAVKKGMKPTEKPNEAADGGGSGTPITRQGVNTMGRGISGRVGGSDGTDPRVENSTGGGRVNLPKGKDDRPAKDTAGGKINWDKVLEINQKVDPVKK